MKNHRWSEADYVVLQDNVNKYGPYHGIKKAAEKLYVTESACNNMYYRKLYKFKKSGIKVDHPEALKNAKVVEETVEQPKKKSKPEFKTKKQMHILSHEEELRLADFLKTEISKNPNNIKSVFRKASIEFDLSVSNIVARWYGCKLGPTDYKKRPTYKGNMGPVFAIVGENATVNGKNQDNPTTKKTGWIMTMIRKWINKK